MSKVRFTPKEVLNQKKQRSEQARALKKARRDQVKNLNVDGLTNLAKMREAIKLIQEYLFDDEDAEEIIASKEETR